MQKQISARIVIAAMLVFLMALGSTSLASAGKPTPTSTAPPPGGQTVVSLTFDDGWADQYAALAIFATHGMKGTFYVNSSTVGDSVHLSWEQLTAMAAAGQEIAGHGLTHANLKNLKGYPLLHEICDDRVALFSHGFQVTSFAYPFGNYNATTQAAVKQCGYNSARTVSGGPETIPPANAYALRAYTNIKSSTSLATMEGYVSGVENAGGGWVILFFHHVCDNCDPLSVTTANLDGLMAWLQTRPATTVVKSINDVIGGTVKPPVPAQ
jgi:peptidoglycan/xylan/chitin deacetylase (PgdA/CDA1 family)